LQPRDLDFAETLPVKARGDAKVHGLLPGYKDLSLPWALDLTIKNNGFHAVLLSLEELLQQIFKRRQLSLKNNAFFSRKPKMIPWIELVMLFLDIRSYSA
jgi:hypothetical protein